MNKLVEANHRALDLQYQLDSAQQDIERLRSENSKLHGSNNLLHQSVEQLAVRIQEIESQNQDLMANGNDLRQRCWKAEMQDKIIGGLDLCHEEGKRKLAEPDEGLLTAEQREALTLASVVLGDYDAKEYLRAAEAIDNLLSGSKPAWEATDERIDGLLAIIGMLNTEVYDTAGPLFDEKNRLVRMLLAMLEGAGK